jgi:hypothetical protein
MTQFVGHPAPYIQLPSVPKRVGQVAIVLLLALAMTATAFLIWGGSNDSPTAKPAVSKSIGGPNETLRGAAVSSAAGASAVPQPSGGPNEAARGQAVGTQPQPAGGPNETLRGHAVQPQP